MEELRSFILDAILVYVVGKLEARDRSSLFMFTP